MKDFGKTIGSYLIAIFIPLLVGGLAATITGESMDAYSSMRQPPLAPPGWVFPVVWTLLYGLMGLASRLVADSGDPRRRAALGLYALQLAVNFLWPIVFFRLEKPLLALLILILLLYLVYGMYRRFRDADRLAGWLILPYLVWLVFALWLNLGVWWLNK